MEGSLSIIVFKKPTRNLEEIFHLSFEKKMKEGWPVMKLEKEAAWRK